MFPPSLTTSSRCIEIRRNFRRIFLYSGVQIISRIIRLICQKQTSQNKPYRKSVTKFRIAGRIECPKVVALQQFFGLYFQFQKIQVVTGEYPCITNPVFEPYSATYGLIAPLKCTIDFAFKSTPSMYIISTDSITFRIYLHLSFLLPFLISISE